MKKLCIILAVLIVAVAVFAILPSGVAFADEGTDTDQTTTDETTTTDNTDTEETAEEPILTDEELTALQEILDKLKNAQSEEEITDIIQQTIFSRIGEWCGEYKELIAYISNIVISAIIVVLYKRSGKYSLGLLKNNKAVVEAVNTNTTSNEKMTANNEIMLANSTEATKSAKIAQLSANATLEMINLLITKSSLDEASKSIATRILDTAQANIEKIVNE